MNLRFHTLRVVATALASLVFASFALAQGVEGHRYTPGPFDAVVISGSALIRLVQGSDDSVFIEGDDEAQRAVSFDLEGGTLRVNPSGAWKFWRSRQQQIVVTARDLKRIEISGSAEVVAPESLKLRQLQVRISGAGTVRLDKLKAERLDFNVSGKGTGLISGAVEDLVVRISGRGTYLGENLACQVADITVSGAGDLKVWAVKDLTASVSGFATIDFWGSAAVHRTSSGIMTWNDRGPKR
jgi:hypothetical protein